MSSQTEQRPRRSSGSSSGKRYRFKSYMEANTQDRARFESMQDHVADRINEVMASFREEKLTIHPHRSSSSAISSAGIATITQPLTLIPPPMPSASAFPRWTWWILGAAVLLLAGLIWNDQRSHSSAAVQGTFTPTAIEPTTNDVTSTPQQPDTDTMTTSPAPAYGKVTAQAGPIEKTAKAAITPSPAPVKPVAKPRKKTTHADSTSNHHYSEDLTDLLQDR